MTAKAAAKILGITEYSVYRLIKAGRILADKFGPVWMIDRPSVDSYLARNEGKSSHDPTRE